MSTDALRELYAALNRGDIDALMKDFDQDIAWIEPAHYSESGNGTYRGCEVVKAHFVQARSKWAEGSCEPERFAGAGDKIVAFLKIHVRLKNETDWRDGRHAAAFTFRNGKVVEMRIIEDEGEALEWLQQR
jgi:ketosteroid isomerase-like protein